MTLNGTGITAAVCAFLGIWLGHRAVRKVESLSANLHLPMLLFAAAGLGMEALALQAPSRAVSAGLGILGITLLWDTLELWRQQKRVQKGHAPANPNNPRHARILAEYPAATAVNPLRSEEETALPHFSAQAQGLQRRKGR